MTHANRDVKYTIETYVSIGQSQSTGRKRRSADRDIISQIQAIEKEAVNFILEDIQLPSDVTVLETKPIEVLKFVQLAPDRSKAADCSSGSCHCYTGFIDNGQGCEKMTEQQVAITQGPRSSLWTVIDQVDKIFRNTRPNNSRTKLMEKWQKIGQKFQDRFYLLANQKSCNFSESFTTDNMVWEGPPCWVRFQYCFVIS